MFFVKSIYNLFGSLAASIIDALFPRSNSEQELFSFSPQEAWTKLKRANKPPFHHLYSVFSYKEPRVTKLIWNIKYKKSNSAVKIAGYALHRTLLQQKIGLPEFQNIPLILVPIPITAQRLRERGFNQCHLLVDEIARLQTELSDSNAVTQNYKSTNPFIIEKELLERIHHDGRHTLKNREERLESAKGIFAVVQDRINSTYPDRKQTLIVIDDVITTGSTVNEAIETLKSAGFKNVFGLSVAH